MPRDWAGSLSLRWDREIVSIRIPSHSPQQSFLANWWFTSHGGKMKQSTSFPVISFGTAAVTLYTSDTSLLGNLIGGNTDSNFSFLSVRGVYPAATMTVTIKASPDR